MIPTPKEKAIELQKSMFQKIFDIDNGVHTIHDVGRYIASIQCALISVDEILNLGLLITDSNKLFVNCAESQCLSYWLQVKIELEKL